MKDCSFHPPGEAWMIVVHGSHGNGLFCYNGACVGHFFGAYTSIIRS